MCLWPEADYRLCPGSVNGLTAAILMENRFWMSLLYYLLCNSITAAIAMDGVVRIFVENLCSFHLLFETATNEDP